MRRSVTSLWSNLHVQEGQSVVIYDMQLITHFEWSIYWFSLIIATLFIIKSNINIDWIKAEGYLPKSVTVTFALQTRFARVEQILGVYVDLIASQ